MNKKLKAKVLKLLDELDGDILYDSSFDESEEVDKGGSDATKGVERVGVLVEEIRGMIDHA